MGWGITIAGGGDGALGSYGRVDVRDLGAPSPPRIATACRGWGSLVVGGALVGFGIHNTLKNSQTLDKFLGG